MSLREYLSTEVTDFLGPYLRREVSDVPPNGSLLSLNSEFNVGQVATRKGFGVAFNPNEPMNTMYNWVKNPDGFGTAGSYLWYYNPSTGNIRVVPYLTIPTPQTAYTLAGCAGVSFASNGTRLFSSGFDSTGSGVGQARVTTVIGAAIFTDKAFSPPMQAKPTLSAISGGSITAGAHRVGYVIQTRSGFLGQISPVTAAGVFDTTSAITVPSSSSGSTIRLTFTSVAWPADAVTLWPVLSPVIDPNRFFYVQDVSTPVPGGSTFSITIDISINDDDLMATGTEVTDNQLLFTQTQAGSGPFNPSVVIEYGTRVVYLTVISGIPQAYASEPGAAQNITADQHVFYLPGLRQMVTGFAMPNGNLYICGPNWTYRFRDNGQLPVQWGATPVLVDGTIGTLAPLGITVNTSAGIAWVPHVTGMYMFNGSTFQSLPASYEIEPDWKRINWNAAATIRSQDNRDKQRVEFLVPLDGATTPSHLMVFDYTNGLDPENIKYSLWNVASYPLGATALVQNPSTKLTETWIGSSSANPILRQMIAPSDSTPYNDNGQAINWQHELGLMPGLSPDLGTVYHHYAGQIRAQGNGTLNVTEYGLDRTQSVNWSVALGATPGQAYTARFPSRLRSESVSQRFTMNQANNYCILSAYQHYFQKGPTFR